MGDALPRSESAANPVADFLFSPADPSALESVQFNDSSYDPAQAGIASASWDLGDGATAIGSCPSHRFAADGEYRARLTVTTADGRSASIIRVVTVRTHDVAIVELRVPRSARPGETTAIAVAVTSLRYPETVQVELFRDGGVEPLGRLLQPVPPWEPTTFDFMYTFTAEDAAAGTVTFRAVATLAGARDAQPADNAVVATPVEVLPPAA